MQTRRSPQFTKQADLCRCVGILNTDTANTPLICLLSSSKLSRGKQTREFTNPESFARHSWPDLYIKTESAYYCFHSGSIEEPVTHRDSFHVCLLLPGTAKRKWRSLHAAHYRNSLFSYQMHFCVSPIWMLLLNIDCDCAQACKRCRDGG